MNDADALWYGVGNGPSAGVDDMWWAEDEVPSANNRGINGARLVCETMVQCMGSEFRVDGVEKCAQGKFRLRGL